jgi:hypothetical protein
MGINRTSNGLGLPPSKTRCSIRAVLNKTPNVKPKTCEASDVAPLQLSSAKFSTSETSDEQCSERATGKIT